VNRPAPTVDNDRPLPDVPGPAPADQTIAYVPDYRCCAKGQRNPLGCWCGYRVICEEHGTTHVGTHS
jgi:hypothetical protein